MSVAVHFIALSTMIQACAGYVGQPCKPAYPHTRDNVHNDPYKCETNERCQKSSNVWHSEQHICLCVKDTDHELVGETRRKHCAPEITWQQSKYEMLPGYRDTSSGRYKLFDRCVYSSDCGGEGGGVCVDRSPGWYPTIATCGRCETGYC